MRLTLKLALLREDVSQYQIAARCGISETRLSRLVQGRAQPTAEERAQLSRELGIAEERLFDASNDVGGDQ